MTKYFTNNFSVINLYKKPSVKSEVVTQMIYGESFSISKKSKKWLKIKIKEDNYKGYILNKKFSNFLRPTHKVVSLKAKIFKFPNRLKKNEITFGSKIKVIENNSKFLKFANGWLKKDDVKPVAYKEKNPFRKITSFKNIRYKWGGKSFRGIDCSALVQVFLNFNNKFCPRDAKDQVKGHVAVALSDKKLIHAYGPMKKTVIMDINQTIKRVKRTAKLKVIGIKRL